MDIDCPQDGNCPAILQLRKWDFDEFPYNPSSFREGFISPARKSLLLHSDNFEALLIPLVKDQSVNDKDPEIISDETSRSPPELNVPSCSGSDDCCSSRVTFSRSNDHSHICDVDSVAWGLCVGSCDQHGESSFQELLFVCGNRGVVVHAFPQIYKSSKVVKPAQGGDVERGMWVEWGQPTTLSPCLKVPEESKLHFDSSKTRTNGVYTEYAEDRPSASVAQKTWLRTFLTRVETRTSGSDVCTKFPNRAFFPDNVVVSFRIFDQESRILDFLSPDGHTSPEQLNGNMIGVNTAPDKTDTDPSLSLPALEDDSASNSRGGGVSNLYKCVKIFSSSSNHLVGFVLSMINSPSFNIDSVEENCIGIWIVVARLVYWGIQWVCSIRLDKFSERHPLGEWVDFIFSLRYLICLSKSGLLSFYGATNGVFVASVDIVTIYRFDCCPSFQEPKSNGSVPNEGHDDSDPYIDSLSGKRKFRRLLMFPHSSMLGVMDESGVTFMLCTDNLVQMNHCLLENVIPHQDYFNFELLIGWEVCAAEIGYQRAFDEISAHQDKNLLPGQSRSSYFGNLRRNILLKSVESNIMHWRSQNDPYNPNRKKFLDVNSASCLIRKVILPPVGHNEDGVICCSPFGITHLIKRDNYGKKWGQVVHSNLHLDFIVNDEINYNKPGWEASSDESVGCNFNGFLYLVTKDGLSVVLPSISVPSNFFPVEAFGYRLSKCTSNLDSGAGNLFGITRITKLWSPSKLEVLDRVLLYEGPEIAEQLCLENGWDLEISRIRRLQLALDLLKFDEIEKSLEMLMDVNLAEEGILRLLFATVYLILSKASIDNEVFAASRLLALATSFATRAIRKYGLLQHEKDPVKPRYVRGGQSLSLSLVLTDRELDEDKYSRRLKEMANFLVVIRNLQRLLDSKFKRPGQGLMDIVGLPSLVNTDLTEDELKIPVVAADLLLLDKSAHYETALSASETDLSKADNLALMPVGKVAANTGSDFQNTDGAVINSVGSTQGSTFGKRIFQFENPRDMITRWEIDNLDLKTVVKDALLSGRLPLAVLRLHLHHLNDYVPGTESHDNFNDIRVVGRAIAYDLFLQDEIGLAITTLQKLGEDVETTLKQLVFGTVRRSLRVRVAEEMERFEYLGSQELKILELVSLIERVYPCSSFFGTLTSRWKELKKTANEVAPGEISLHLLHPLFNNLIISCGDIDGVVLGSWTSVDDRSIDSEVDGESNYGAYWSGAVAWSDAWDQRVTDRVLLDQPLLMGVNILWESQLEYHACHNDWSEVCKLLEVIPSYALCSGRLSIRLDGIHSASDIECGGSVPGYRNFTDVVEELDIVCMAVPSIQVFRFSESTMCSESLRMLLEVQLAKNYIFLNDYWHGTEDIVSLLARSGFIFKMHDKSLLEAPIDCSSDDLLVIGDVSVNPETVLALHKVVVHFCAQYNLLNFLDIYLDHHNLAVDNESLSLFLDATGDNEWAKWLLLLRVKGREYDGSFSNARAVALHNLVPGSKLSILEVDDIMHAVDDIAEGAGEMAAIATLMFAPIPLQECLSSGSVNRHYSSAQCTLENLRPALQRFPTLWIKIVAACFGQEPSCGNLPIRTQVSGYSDLFEYLKWREGVFSSSVRDTSFLQMIPCWFPKSVRRLIQLFVQGPIGWHTLADSENGELSMLRDIYYVVNSSGHAQISAMSWEAAVQKHIEEELYVSSLEGTGVGLEHHLHRGHAMAALNHVLSARVYKLKSDGKEEGKYGPLNVQSDVQILLAPLTKSEESLLSSVIPLAIAHFDDTVLVASCAFLLELCGLSADIMRIDVASLRRISSFYKSAENNQYKHISPKVSVFYPPTLEIDLTETLARALADDYLRECSSNMTQKGDTNYSTCNQPSRALMLVLQHLERASLLLLTMGTTCGSWLSSGNGDGADLRSQQKASSQLWKLVIVFCRMHNIPLSTKYLAVLARDNDWVGFLSEAQVGKYPFEAVIQVASKEFSDPRLKIHILTVLKSMQSRKKLTSSSKQDSVGRSDTCLPDENLYIPVELFGIIAECEKQEHSGDALLLKAKNLSWSILAMIASCFPDVSPLSCLIVWLEITAARETSAIKVNDIASQIAKNVGAAVETTNSLPANSRTITFHYNRRNSKRRRLVEPIPVSSLTLEASAIADGVGMINDQSIVGEAETDKLTDEDTNFSNDSDGVAISLSRMVAVLCEQHLFLPLLQAFEIFLPSCSLLPFIRALQAFSQLRVAEASAHLGSFSTRIKEESPHIHQSREKEGTIGISWISSTAAKAADAILSRCSSPYEKRCLLQLLSATDFSDGGSAATRYGRLYWKINLAEPSLRSDDFSLLGNETLDDASLLAALEKNGYWEQARSWAKQLEASGESRWKSAVNHVTEMQAEAMVSEWKEYLWDVQEERVALWSHCQTLFIRYSFPAMQAGLFFLKHAESAEKDIPAKELHELLLLSLQWLSGMITLSHPFYPMHLLREIETRVWLLAVESEAQVKNEGDSAVTYPTCEARTGKGSDLIDRTASIITKMDNHITALRNRTSEKNDRENSQSHIRIPQTMDSSFSNMTDGNTKTKRRPKGSGSSRKPISDAVDRKFDSESTSLNLRYDSQLDDENFKIDASISRWEERVGPAELERAVLSLLDFGQTSAARQLQNKLSPEKAPAEFSLVDAALKLAALSTPGNKISISTLDDETCDIIRSYNLLGHRVIEPLKILENLAAILTEGSGQGLCKRIISVVKTANVLGLLFSEAFDKQPIELLQLLSLKAQDCFDEANLLVRSHSMPAASIAQILAESFLKGLLAAHRGGYMESQEEGPAPLLWRFSDFLKWAELCPSDSEIGHALMRLVITGQAIPHACEVELLILSHHFYKSSACLDGVDVLVALAATRVEAYVWEGDFSCLARLITGVGNFHALDFILGILIENGQLDLLLQKYSAAADANSATAEAVRGFRMAVLISLKQINPSDLDAFAMVYNHFDMKHETASLLELRAKQSSQQWFLRNDKDQNEDLLESMCYFIKAAEVHSSIDAGNKTLKACAQASLVSLQIRMPDTKWLDLSETNARRILVEQFRFQEALIVAEAYGLNQPSEWALVLWEQMLDPELTEQFVAEFVAVLPLQPAMLIELARFYRSEMQARGHQSQFSVWLTGGGLPTDWKYLAKSFRCLLRRTRDIRLKLHLATTATGFGDVIEGCNRELDKVPDNAGPLILRKGHGGAYLPLM